jgi:mevalonate kinase
MQQNFRGNGKLLITGEYFVLDGAKALALPTRFGQLMRIEAWEEKKLVWESYDEQKKAWFKAEFALPDLTIINTEDEKTAITLQQMLLKAKENNIAFLSDNQGLRCRTKLEFTRDWGLGSSSTLIYMIAQWAEINPYWLLNETMGGSGYDIACAGINIPIIYQRNGIQPIIQEVTFNPPFADNLFFVHLGKKQNSREGIARYRSYEKDKNLAIQRIALLTENMLNCSELIDFEELIVSHESLISSYLELPTVKKSYFSDYWGALKSLGAWGGDFILATSDKDEATTRAYFNKRGFDTVLTYKEMILSH